MKDSKAPKPVKLISESGSTVQNIGWTRDSGAGGHQMSMVAACWCYANGSVRPGFRKRCASGVGSKVRVTSVPVTVCQWRCVASGVV
jgi:hypothetical protein